jgi:hypothetical protein
MSTKAGVIASLVTWLTMDLHLALLNMLCILSYSERRDTQLPHFVSDDLSDVLKVLELNVQVFLLIGSQHWKARFDRLLTLNSACFASLQKKQACVPEALHGLPDS